MTRVQSIQLKQSEARQRLTALLDDPDKENRQEEMGKISLEMRSLETELQAALQVETLPLEQRQDGPEAREMRSLEGRSNAGEIVDFALGRQPVEGATAELQQHHGLDSNMIPLALLRRQAWETSPLETRAVTPAPADVGTSQRQIIPYVFPDASAAFLGVAMPTVAVGEQSFPVLTSKLAVRTPAENADADETDGSFSAEVLAPSRIQASFFFSREDRARFAGMDQSLRENLNMGLQDGLDAAIIAGTNGLLNGTNLADNDVTDETTYALYRSQFVFSRVDGRFASVAGDIRVLMGSETYAHAASQYRGNADNVDALMSMMQATGGVRVSAHIPAASNANRQDALIRMGMNHGLYCSDLGWRRHRPR